MSGPFIRRATRSVSTSCPTPWSRDTPAHCGWRKPARSACKHAGAGSRWSQEVRMRIGNAIGWRGSHRFQCNTPRAFGVRKRSRAIISGSEVTVFCSWLLLLPQLCRGHAACGTAFLNALHGALVLTLPKRSSRWPLRATFRAGKENARKGLDKGAIAPPG